MEKLKLQVGTGMPRATDWNYMQDGIKKALGGILSNMMQGGNTDHFISGCEVTEEVDGTNTTYTIAAGYACFKGEVMEVVEHSIVKTNDEVVYLSVNEVTIDATPMLNRNAVSEEVKLRRTMKLTVADALPLATSEYMLLTAKTQDQIFVEKFGNRFVQSTMAMPYFGPMSVFDSNGTGNVGGPMEGWQICNGYNGKPDMRGMVFMGASNIDAWSQGSSDLHDSVTDHNVQPGSVVGRDKVKLTNAEMPKHHHEANRRGMSTFDEAEDPGAGERSVITDTQLSPISGTYGITPNQQGGDQPHENRQPSFAGVWISPLV